MLQYNEVFFPCISQTRATHETMHQYIMDIHVQIRIYEKTGAGMEWHLDDIIYENTKQIEVVFTLENTSDCCTMWRPHDQPIILSTAATIMSTATKSLEDDSIIISSSSSSKHDNTNNNKYRVESVQTTPNSAILIKAGNSLPMGGEFAKCSNWSFCP